MPRIPVPAPFRIRSFRFQRPADLLTSWAFEMEALILGWYVLVETGSVLLLTLFAALGYGGTLIAPLMGVAGDRIGHRKLMAGMRATYAAVAATLMICALTSVLNPFLVCVLAAVTGMVRPSDMGLRGALIAETMPGRLLTGAMGISRTTSDSARIAGALAGAGLAATLSMGHAYVVITAFYALGALLTLGTAPVRPAASAVAAPVAEQAAAGALPSPRPSPWRDLREGLVYVWRTPSLLAIVWLAFLFNGTAFSITNGLLPYVAKEIYHTNQTGLGTLVASCALGALIGSIAFSRLHVVDLPRLMIVAAIFWHALLLIFSHMPTMSGALASLMLAGFAQSLCMVSHTVILLRAANERLRGRVMGVRMMAIYSLPLGLVAAGFMGAVGAAPQGFDFRLDPPYARYRALVAAIPRPLPELLVAHPGLPPCPGWPSTLHCLGRSQCHHP